MVTPKFRIPRGATPTLELQLPIDVSTGTWVVYVTFVQNHSVVLEYALNGTPSASSASPGSVSVDSQDGNTLLVDMTQADTLLLSPGDVELQVRIKSPAGLADTFLPEHGVVINNLKGGAI